MFGLFLFINYRIRIIKTVPCSNRSWLRANLYLKSFVHARVIKKNEGSSRLGSSLGDFGAGVHVIDLCPSDERKQSITVSVNWKF